MRTKNRDCNGSHRVCGVELSLKWPNDVYAGGDKVGGVLVKAAHQGEQVMATVGQCRAAVFCYYFLPCLSVIYFVFY